MVSAPELADATPLRVAVCVCTYQRNAMLRRLLDRVVEISDASTERYQIGLVVVDDNDDGGAMPVVEEYRDAFPLGVHYRQAGGNNISICRNLALESAVTFGDLLVMTDDDCVPDIDWIDQLIDTKSSTGADSVSGVLVHVFPAAAPTWFEEQSIYDFAAVPAEDGAELDHGQTNNCVIDVAWLLQHPGHRFDPAYGHTGGEDMVFFRDAIALGLRSVHSAGARVTQFDPIEDATLGAVTRLSYWLGNSEAVTNLACGHASRKRLALRGLRRLLSSAARPIRRIVRGDAPHVRYSLVRCAGAVGVLSGAFGIRARHH